MLKHVIRAFGTSSSGTNVYSDRIPKIGDQIYVAMSSGVDSSTVAALMAEKYTNVKGVFMANWSSTSKCMENDWNDVQKVCRTIGIPCERVNFEKTYWTEVFEPMISLYKKGLTPNPDVACNRHVKFGALFDHLAKKNSNMSNQNWWMATGHYARVAQSHHQEQAEPEEKGSGTNNNCQQNPNLHLMRPKYLAKDQSYYLSSIEPKVLDRILFPLAQYTKPEIRQIAAKYGLHTATKKDSQGLCFVSQSHNNFKDFLADYIEPNPGEVVTEDGKVVGKHDGIWNATIGQRSSVSMPQGNPQYKGTWFVSEKKPEKNQLVIVRGRDNSSLYSKGVTCSKFRWLVDRAKIRDFDPNELTVQYRSLQEPEKLVRLDITSGGDGSDEVSAEFANARRAVAPGQYLVVYYGDHVLGSGTIASTF